VQREFESEVEKLQTLLGFNRYQAKAYLAVVSGFRTAREISGKTRIPVTRVYDTLQTLIDLGLVVKTEKGYFANNPRAALLSLLDAEKRSIDELFQRKRNNVLELVKSLERYRRSSGEEPNVSVVVGLRAVYSKTVELCERGGVLIFAVRKALKLKNYFMKAVEGMSGKRVFFIFHSSITLEPLDKKFLESLGAETAFSPGVLMDMLVTDAGEAMLGLPFDDEPIAVWIKHKGFVDSLAQALREVTNF